MSRFTEKTRIYVRENYQTQGGAYCAARLGLTIDQVWGLAARIGVAKRRGSQRHAMRIAESGHRGVPNQRKVFQACELETALRGWSATRESLEERLAASPL